MEFSQFKIELYEALSNRVKEQLSGTLRPETVVKGSGHKNGFIYMPENGAVGMTFYTENAYEAYQSGMGIDAIAETIIEIIRDHSAELEAKTDVDVLFRPENIVPELIPTMGNEEFLKTVPHVPMGDMQIIFKMELPDFLGGAAADMSFAYMEQQGWDEKKLLEIARNNHIFRDDIRLTPLTTMASTMSEIALLERSANDDLSFLSKNPSKAVILTNSLKYRGAASILDTDVMAKVAAVFDKDLYIAPSSIHECIVFMEDKEGLEELQKSIYEINRSSVPPEERLSDNIYHFDRITKEITMTSRIRERIEQPEPQFAEQKRR